MIVIRVLLEVQPEKQQDLVQFMHNSVTVSNRFEGCAKYNLYQDIGAENTFLLYEEWETQEQFDAYKASDHFKESGRVLFPLLVGTPDSLYFDAQVIPA